MLLPNISSKFPIFSELSVETTTAENIVYSSAILGVSGLLTVKRLPSRLWSRIRNQVF